MMLSCARVVVVVQAGAAEGEVAQHAAEGALEIGAGEDVVSVGP